MNHPIGSKSSVANRDIHIPDCDRTPDMTRHIAPRTLRNYAVQQLSVVSLELVKYSMFIQKAIALTTALLFTLASAKASAADSPSLVHPGEIAVAGLIENASGKASLTLQAAWVSTPDGKVTHLQPARSKLIQLDGVNGGGTAVIAFRGVPEGDHALGPGMAATAIGPDLGPGEPLPARTLIVWPTGSPAADGRTVQAPAGAVVNRWEIVTGAPLPAIPAPDSVKAPASDTAVAPEVEGSGGIAATSGLKPDSAAGAPQAPPSPPALDHPYDYDYSAVDGWVAATPPSAEGSVTLLAAYLARGAKNQRELARAIFGWIATHIAYDYDGIAARTTDPAPAHVLASGAAECVGNSQLFAALAKAAGLNAVPILGVSRSVWWDPVFQIAPGHSSPTHCWDAVQIDGQWRLLDVTNDETMKKQNGLLQKQRDYDPEWFLVSPDQFLYTHIPDDPAWQLRTTLVAANADAALPYLRPSFFRYGLKVVGENHPALHCDDHLDLTLQAPADCFLYAELSPLGKDPLRAGYTLAERDGGKFRIRVVFPAPGAYQLRLFAHPPGERVFRDVVAEWRVDAASGSDSAQVPTICGPFSDAGCCLYRPFTRTLQAGAPQTFQIRVPGALHVGIITSGQILPLKAEGDLYTGVVTPLAGQLQIAAEFPAQPGAYAGLVIYDVQ